MTAEQSVQILLPVAALYVGLFTAMFAVMSSHTHVAPFLELPMRYLRWFTTALAVKLGVELLLAYGKHLAPLFQAVAVLLGGGHLKGSVALGDLGGGVELVVGTLLVFLLWNLREPFYELEQMANHP